mmetsp:Transcript_3132/g.7042  ORF Transcript_3132/g.7042 Transcript_3132/m.7042 type:complete len:148 (+) Transcript_3132:565-1008(+)
MMLVYRVGDYPCYMETKDQRRRDLQEELQEQRQRRMATMKDYEDLKKCLNWNVDHPEDTKRRDIAEMMMKSNDIVTYPFFKDVTGICIRFKVGAMHSYPRDAALLCKHVDDEETVSWSEAAGVQADLIQDMIAQKEDGGDKDDEDDE